MSGLQSFDRSRRAGQVTPVETLKDKLLRVANPGVRSAVPTTYITGDVKRLPDGHLDVKLADPTTLLISTARVTAVDPQKKSVTFRPGQILRCARMLEGKRARNGRSTEAKDYLITASAGGDEMQASFVDEAAARAFSPGDEANFYDLGIGDRITISCAGEHVQ